MKNQILNTVFNPMKYSAFQVRVAIILLVSFIGEVITPVVILALPAGGGAVQTDFVGSTSGGGNMVDMFSGQFNYDIPVIDIPGANGGGYSMTLNYRSNNSPDEDASWVGYGWSLNAGAITRTKRGFADDMKKEEVTYYHKTEPAITMAVGPTSSTEVFDKRGTLGASRYVRYNSQKGYSFGSGIFASALGCASLGLNLDQDNGASFSMGINPLEIVRELTKSSPNKSNNEDAASQAVENTNEELEPLVTVTKEESATVDFSGLTLPDIQANFNFGSSQTPKSLNNIKFEGRGAIGNPGVFFSSKSLAGEQYGLYGMYNEISPSDNFEVKTAYGYLYGKESDGVSASASIQDYYSEKERNIDTKKTNFLPPPFANADIFLVNANGVSGVFRAHQKGILYYRPNFQHSDIILPQFGPQLILPNSATPPPLPQTYGGSMSYTNATTTLDIRGDGAIPNIYGVDSREDPFFFRFINDPGGNVLHASNDEPTADWWQSGAYFHKVNRGNGVGGSKTILYRTNGELAGNYSLYSYCAERYSSTSNERTQWVGQPSKVSEKDLFKYQMGEYSIVDAQGIRYNFGLPVYARNEVNAGYNVKNAQLDNPDISKAIIATKLIDPTTALGSEEETIVGESHPTPYVSSFLLTEILTPDYVDVTKNGLTSDDKGGWTKFSYTRSYGSQNKFSNNQAWYKWRVPYSGLHYNQNSLSDTKDDILSVSYGEKEVYYLEQVETATHIAKFILNDIQTSPRLDCRSANLDERAAAGGLVPLLSTNNIRYLVAIELYTKDVTGNPAKLLKTVRFAYDYSTWPGTPNSVASGGGRLTLKKVWFEYQGVIETGVAPYEFSYVYPTTSPTGLAPYTGTSLANLFGTYTALNQTPSYSPLCIDRWGFYQSYNIASIPNYFTSNPWVNQNPATTFDPAAWHLKVIKLPTGGEIHVQYEQNDYQYVQDRRAMTMVKVSQTSQSLYTISDAELGITTSTERNNLVSLLKNQFVDERERMFYKFLYNTTNSISLCAPIYEYITGYVRITGVSATSTGIAIALDVNPSNRPEQATYDFLKANNYLFDMCKGSGLLGYITSNPLEALSALSAAAADISTLIGSVPPLTSINFTDNTDGTHPSFIRIPLLKPKKGGGIRVKRIITVSPEQFVENGISSISGTEYHYTTKDARNITISSGVATNEPLNGRSENAIVRLLEQDFPSVAPNGLVAGENINYYEGPLGEYLLPSASIGYSKVTVTSLYSGNTSPGYQISEYYTVKDVPSVRVKKTQLVKNEKNDDMRWLTNPVSPESEEYVEYYQGYSFIMTSVHGLPRTATTYAGNYSPAAPLPAFTTKTEYTYFMDDKGSPTGEGIPVMYDLNRPLRIEKLGKEMEIIHESRNLEEKSLNVPVHASVAITYFYQPIPPPPPLIYPNAFGYYQRRYDKLTTHVVNKIVSYGAFLKRVETITADGISHTTENIAFSPTTGEAALVGTTDGYHNTATETPDGPTHNGTYYSYSIPASARYPAMGQRSVSERYKFFSNQSIPALHAHFVSGAIDFDFSSVAPNDHISRLNRITAIFTPGDIIAVRGQGSSSISAYIQLGDIVPGYTRYQYEVLSGSVASLSSQVDLEIIKSAKTNNLTAQAEQLSLYGKSEVQGSMEQIVGYAMNLKDKSDYTEGVMNNWLTSAIVPGYQMWQRVIYDNKLTFNLNAGQDVANVWGVPSITQSTLSDFDMFDFLWNYGAPTPTSPCGSPCSYPLGGTPHYYMQDDYFFEILPIIPGSIKIGWVQAHNRSLSGGYSWNLNYSGVGGLTSFPVDFIYQEIPTFTPLSIVGLPRIPQQWFYVNDEGFPVYYPCSDYLGNQANLAFVFREMYNSPSSTKVYIPSCNTGTPCSAAPIGSPPVKISALGLPGTTVPSADNLNVLSASVQTYSDNWDGVPNGGLTNGTVFERGEKGRWRPKESFVYRGATSSFNIPVGRSGLNDPTGGTPYTGFDKRSFNTGFYKTFTMYDWKNPTNNSEWQSTGRIEKYAVDGYPVETSDVINIHSASHNVDAVYNWPMITPNWNSIPAIQGVNTTVNEIWFESFEHVESIPLQQDDWWNLYIETNDSHTGDKCISTGSETNLAYTLTSFVPIQGRKYILQFWYKTLFDNQTPTFSIMNYPPTTSQVVNTNVRSGDWRLYSYIFEYDDLSGFNYFSLKIDFNTGDKVYLDDLRIQPYDAEAQCYVYDKNRRLRASFDNNHFATIYQYNGRGANVRAIKETERGFYTLTDNHINMPLVPRPTISGGGILTSSAGGSTPQPQIMTRTPISRSGQNADKHSEDVPLLDEKFDILEFKLSPEGKKLKVLGQDSLKVPTLRSLKKKVGLPSLPLLPSADDSLLQKYGVPKYNLQHSDSILYKKIDAGQYNIRRRDSLIRGRIKSFERDSLTPTIIRKIDK